MLRHWLEKVLLQHPGEDGSLKPFPKKQSQTPSTERPGKLPPFSESLPTHVTCIFEFPKLNWSPSSNKILLKTGHWYFNRSHYEKPTCKASKPAQWRWHIPHRAQSQYLLDNSFLLNKKSKTVEGEKIHRTLDYSATQHLNSTLLLAAS